MNEDGAIAALLAAARAVGTRWPTASDDELLGDGRRWEALGRLVDARRAAFAAEVDSRSQIRSGETSLAFRHGERDGASLVAHVLKVALSTARRWTEIGTALAPVVDLLSGEELPGRHPVLAEAVHGGLMGLDSARVIADTLHRGRKAEAALLAEAEAELTEQALQVDTEALRDAARHRGDALDQDGPEPRDARAHRNRRFAFGRADEDGGSRFSGYAPAEDHAILEAALAAVRKQAVMERHAAGEEENEGLGAEWRERDGEHRTAAQFDYDTVAGVLTAGIRASAAEPTASSMLRSIPEVVVTTTVDDLQDARRGSGWIGGLRIPVATVQRISCGADVRLHIDGDAGEDLHLGRRTRLFSSAQRKALITRYGGCAWPSCTAPAAWCDAHHIAWYGRDEGPTDVDNGILLCSFHHHLVHAATARWCIVVEDGRPWLVPVGWRGEPDRRQRMQQHPRRLMPRPVDPDPWARPLRT